MIRQFSANRTQSGRLKGLTKEQWEQRMAALAEQNNGVRPPGFFSERKTGAARRVEARQNLHFGFSSFAG